MDKILKFKESVKKDCEKYKKIRKSFYTNPMHWDNNKRRRYGLSALRNSSNKYRSKTFRSYGLFSPETFEIFEDIIDDAISCSIAGESYFDKFATMKDLNFSNEEVFYAAE